MKCKNKHFKLKEFKQTAFGSILAKTDLQVIITNDAIGKTVTVTDGVVGFTFPADDIYKYLQ